MSWYDKDWKYRIPFMLHNATSGTARDGAFVLPTDIGKFWRNIQDDADDLRVTKADGRTLLTYDINGLNYGNKAGTIRIDGYDWSGDAWGNANSTATANTALSSVQGFIYFGNADASSAAGNSVSLSNEVSMSVDLSAPGAAGAPIITCTAQRNEQTETDQVIAKQSTEGTRVWWDLRQCMLYRRDKNENSRLLEEIAWVRISCFEGDTVDRTTAMTPVDSVQYSNFHIVSHALQGGASGITYLLTLTIGTDDGMGGTRILEKNCTLKVQDLIAIP